MIIKIKTRTRAELRYLPVAVLYGATALALSGCSIGSSCLMSAKEGDSFEELVLAPDKEAPTKYRVKGLYREGFEQSELDLGTTDAPIVYCVRFERECSKFMDRRFGSDVVHREVNLAAIVTYEKERGLNCPFGTLTIQRIIEAESKATNPKNKNSRRAGYLAPEPLTPAR